jgi:hypothetical protein
LDGFAGKILSRRSLHGLEQSLIGLIDRAIDKRNASLLLDGFRPSQIQPVAESFADGCPTLIGF